MPRIESQRVKCRKRRKFLRFAANVLQLVAFLVQSFRTDTQGRPLCSGSDVQLSSGKLKTGRTRTEVGGFGGVLTGAFNLLQHAQDTYLHVSSRRFSGEFLFLETF